jgi:hypothetical protein
MFAATSAPFETELCRPIAVISGQRIFSKIKRGFSLMKAQILIASVLVATLCGPLAAHAQGVPGGIAHGIYEGNRRAGPVGAVVGGAVGGVIGGIEGVLGVDHYYQTSYSEQPYSERPYSERPHKSARHHKVSQ